MRKQLSGIIALAVTLILADVFAASPVRSQPPSLVTLDEAGYSNLADRINAGSVSEEQFLKMGLNKAQTLEVFKHIRDKRGWMLNDEELTEALDYPTGNTSPTESSHLASAAAPFTALGGSCAQPVELESGDNHAAFPVSQGTPNSGECGNDKDDIILLYNTPNLGRGDADNVRVWSHLWTVRTVIRRAYGGRVGANGLCQRTTRVCMGSAGQKLGRDLSTLYLWLK